jgi:tetratricopeptide (TPR) repeat protein
MTYFRKTTLLLALCTALTASAPAFAVEDEFGIEHPSRSNDTNAIDRAVGGEYPGAIQSVDAMQIGEATGASLSNSARYCLETGNYDKAIKLSKLAVEKDYDDTDTHMIFAEALEKKYNKQVEKDPALFNKCVKEWLIVLRNEAGMEKGMAWHGMQIPLMEEFYKDEEHTMPARSHILALTGFLPKWHETDARFLKKVGKPVDTDVSGKVVASEGKSVKNSQSSNKQNDKKQISVRNGSIDDAKKSGPDNEQ